MKTYYGEFDNGRNPIATVKTDSGDKYDLPLRLDLDVHSPAGFEWGYTGSGPAQLALAVLADCVGGEVAKVLYQEFKDDYVSRWKRGATWRLSETAIRRWAADKPKRSSDAASLDTGTARKMQAMIDGIVSLVNTGPLEDLGKWARGRANTRDVGVKVDIENRITLAIMAREHDEENSRANHEAEERG